LKQGSIETHRKKKK